MFFNKDGFRVCANRTRNLRRSVKDGGEVDAHKSEHHVMRNMREVEGCHVGCVEDLGRYEVSTEA